LVNKILLSLPIPSISIGIEEISADSHGNEKADNNFLFYAVSNKTVNQTD